MATLESLSPILPVIIECEDHGKIALAFQAAGAFPSGTQVKLKNTGIVDACTDPGDVPFGYVTTPSRAEDEYCTVSVYYTAKLRVLASADVTIGEQVAVSGFTTETTYAPAASGDYAVGIAIQAFDATEYGSILLFNQPILLP